MARCKSCGSEIVWLEMESGKKMPCDPKRVLVIVPMVHPVSYSGPQQHNTRQAYVSHFATCPHADQHRKT